MEEECRISRLKAKVELLTWLDERECECDKSRCAEHFRHIKQLKFEYQNEIDEYEEDTNNGDTEGI